MNPIYMKQGTEIRGRPVVMASTSDRSRLQKPRSLEMLSKEHVLVFAYHFQNYEYLSDQIQNDEAVGSDIYPL